VCDKYSEFTRDACYQESWPLSRLELRTPQGLQEFCSYATTEWGKKSCLGNMLSSITVEFVIEQNAMDKLTNLCTNLPTPMNSECFGFAATRLVQVDPNLTQKAVTVCKTAEQFGISDTCYQYLAAYGSAYICKRLARI
jgi:hypothetical protein